MKKRLNQWSIKHNECISCWKTTHKHASRWQCFKCYDTVRNEEEERKAMRRASQLKSMDKNSEVIKLLAKVKYRLAKWYPCLKLMVGSETKYLPFESLEKPNVPIWFKQDEYLKNKMAFNLLKKYYTKSLTI